MKCWQNISMWTISIEQTSGKYRHLPAYWFFLCFFTIKNKQNEEHLPPDARWYNYIGKKGYAKHFCMTCSGLAGTTLGSRRRRRWQGRGRWQGRATATWFLRLIFCLDLHLWMCRRERPWPRIGCYQFLNFLNLPQVIRTLLPDVAGWWEGDVETAKAAWQFAILSQPSAVVILDNFAIFCRQAFYWFARLRQIGQHEDS